MAGSARPARTGSRAFAIDREADGDLVRLADLRRIKSARVLDELKEWRSSMITLTSLSIGKAAAYTLGNWPKLIRFVDDARVGPSRETKAVPTAIGRRTQAPNGVGLDAKSAAPPHIEQPVDQTKSDAPEPRIFAVRPRGEILSAPPRIHRDVLVGS